MNALHTAQTFRRELPPEMIAALKGRFAERFDAQPGTTYLIRPDQHIAARWRTFDAHALQCALARACCGFRGSSFRVFSPGVSGSAILGDGKIPVPIISHSFTDRLKQQ